MNLRDWLIAATLPATARRAAITALIVGVILSAINHGSAILAGHLNWERVCQMLLTFTVPYMVSTISSVATRREMTTRRITPALPADSLCGAIDPA